MSDKRPAVRAAGDGSRANPRSRRMLAVLSVAAGALVSSPAPAIASDAQYGCILYAASDESGGESVEGVAVGYAASLEGGTVGIQCVVRVNGNPVASTPASFNSPAAVTSAQVSFSANPDDDIDLCGRVTEHGWTSEVCHQGESTWAPPQVVYDTVDPVLAEVWPYAAAVACPVLNDRGGDYGVVRIGGDGDIYVGDDRYVDCAPFSGTALRPSIWIVSG